MNLRSNLRFFAPKAHTLETKVSLVHFNLLQEDVMYLKNDLRLMYLFTFLRNFVFIAPVIYLFLEWRGLSDDEIFRLQAWFHLFAAILEIPTGVLSDVYGSRRTIMIGVAAWIIAMFIYPAFPNYYWLLLGEFVAALAIAAVNGAEQSYIHSLLQFHHSEEKYQRVYGNIAALTIFGGVAGSFCGAYMLKINYWLPYTITGLAGLCALAASGFLPTYPEVEDENSVPVEVSNNFILDAVFRLRKVYAGVLLTFKRRELRWLVLLAGFILALVTIFFWAHKPYLFGVYKGTITDSDFGIVIAFLSMVGGVTALTAPLWTKRVKLFSVLIAIGICAWLMPVGAGVFFRTPEWFNAFFESRSLYAKGLVYSGLWLCLHQVVRGLTNLVVDHELLQYVKGRSKATVVSVKNQLQRIIVFFVNLKFGWFVGHYAITAIFIWSGVVSFFIINIFLVMYFLSRRKYLKNHSV